VGQTEDGLLVVRGVFRLFDTYGVPLDITIDRLRQEGLMPDWLWLFDQMVQSGWHRERSYRRLLQVVGDVYGGLFRVEWEQRMGACLDSS